MDRYFYSVELDNSGNKVIHLYGNIYFNDVDGTETDHREAEWTFFYITLDELNKMITEDCFFEYVNERVDYLNDITKEEATEICSKYFNGLCGINLDIKDVNINTPCDDYWFDAQIRLEKEYYYDCMEIQH